MATRKIYLVRHGEYDWEDRPDPMKGLTERGVEQAHLTAQRLAAVPATAMYSSDLQRAVETAEIIRGALNQVSYKKRRNLRECVPGIPKQLMKHGPFALMPRKRLQTGERRAAAAFSEYFKAPRGDDKHEIIVSHGNLIRYLTARVLEKSGHSWVRMRTLNCGISEIAVESDGRMWLVSYNDVGHLAPQLTTAGVPSRAYTSGNQT